MYYSNVSPDSSFVEPCVYRTKKKKLFPSFPNFEFGGRWIEKDESVMARYNSFPLRISFTILFSDSSFFFFSTIKGKYITHFVLSPMELKRCAKLLKTRRIRIIVLVSLEFNNWNSMAKYDWANTLSLLRDREKESIPFENRETRVPCTRRLSQRSILYRVYSFPPLLTGMYISRSFVVGKNVSSACTKIHFFSSLPFLPPRPTRRVPKRPLSQPFSWPWTLSPCIFVVRRWNNNCLFTSSHRFYIKIKL